MNMLRQNETVPAIPPNVQIGSLYQPVGALWTAWVVRQVLSFPTEALPHVRLQRVDDPGEYKSVSLNALLDERLYRPMDGKNRRTITMVSRLGRQLSWLISRQS